MATLLQSTTIGGHSAIHAGNIGSQSVNYANSAGSTAWTNVSGRPTALSQFTNDLGNYGNWITSAALSGYATQSWVESYYAPRAYVTDSFVDFYIYGDENRYYPVTIHGYNGGYGFQRYSVHRGYSWQAPWDPIGTGGHKGGLTLTFEWSGDIAWGGNDKTVRVIQFGESYTNMVAGMQLAHCEGVVVWLRGGGSGGAHYRLHGPGGRSQTYSIAMSAWTSCAGVTYDVRNHESDIVNSEINNRYPVRNNTELFINNNSVATQSWVQTQAYLTGFTETDPTVPSHVKSITTTEKSNWNTAHGWGNHASAGYLTSLPSHNHDGAYVNSYTTSAGDIDGDWGQSFKTFDPVPSGTPPIASPNLRTINVGNDFNRRTQLAFTYATDQAWFRRRDSSGWQTWREFIHSGNIGSQSVNYASSAGSVAWTNVSGRPTALSQFTNDLTISTTDNTKLPLAGGTMSGTITITNTDIRSNANSNWTGEPGTQGKIQYHANRWYIVSDSASDRIVQFRRNGTDTSYISNDGTFIGNISGSAATATYSTNATRLYASDSPYRYGDAYPYYLYMNYDGGSYWELKVSPATPGTVRVAYANSSGTASQVSIDYNNNSNANYQLLWGSGNAVYGTGDVYVNPSTDVINAKGGYISTSNPWGTANSAYFPNGITTAGNDNWIYGHTYVGNAPSNGSGHEFWSDGSEFHRSSVATTSHGNSGKWLTRQSANGNFIPYSFESERGDHSWGIVARFRINSSSDSDRPSIQFSGGQSDNRWNIGYCQADDQFRITQNMGYRNDNTNSDGWGTERFRIDSSGNTYAAIGGTLHANGSAVITSANIGSQSVSYATSASYADSIYFNGVQRLYGGSDGTRNTGWAYHNNNDTGLHWPNNGWHFYPKDVNDMYMRSGSATNVAIAMNTAGTNRGYVYAENDNTIGFLNNNRSWSFRTYANGNATVYGYLTVNGAGTSSSIYMNDSDNGQREIHCNSDRIGFLTQAGAWGAYCDDAGNWTAANFSGSSSGTNTGDQTNISGNAATANGANGNFYIDDNYGNTVVGVYTSTRYQGVYAMGDAYKLPADGTSTGNLYGLAWSHPNAGGVAGNLNSHGLLVMENGTFLAAVSGSIRARDDMRAPIFYDSNDTSYYLNPAGGSRLRNLYVGDSGDDWSDPGGWGTQVRFSNGPHVKFVLHARTPGIEAGMYVHTPSSVYIGSYTAHSVNMMVGGNSRLLLEDGRVYSHVYMEAAGSMRAPIFYDSNDTAYYLDPNGTSNLNTWTSETSARIGRPAYWTNRYSITTAIGHHTGTNGWGTGEGTWATAWKGGFSGWDIWGTSTDHPQGSGYIHAQGIISGLHHANPSTGANAYGWMMVGAHNATDNRYWLRGKWDNSTSGWVEMITTGNIGSQSVSDASTLGGFGRGNTTNKVAYFDGDRNLYVNNPESYSGEVRLGAAWARGGVYASGTLSLSTSASQIDFVFSNSTKAHFASDGNLWMSWAGAYLSTLLDAKQNASTAINTSNIGSQSVSYASSAGSVAWGNVSSKPAAWLNGGTLIEDVQPGASAFPSGFYQSYQGTGNPTGTWFNYINVRHSNTNNGHGFQLGMSYYDTNLWFRSYQGGLSPSFSSWGKALSSLNHTEYMDAPNKAGTSYYQVQTWMQFNGTHGLYWPAYYDAHFSANDLSTYTQFAFRGSKNSYGGFYDLYSRVNGAMYDSGGNGGVYREANGLWYWYYHVGNNSMGIGGSTNSSSYVVYANGNIYATGDIVAYSDRRKKTDIVTIDSALDKVMAMRGVFYTKIDESDKGRQVGVIAQEVNEILPEAVTYAADVDEYGVKYGNIVGVLIEAIKEQQKEIDELKAKLN